ncbi:MAG: efflux RND transporter periplasmic adaptor subunit [Gemmataceae bacterium]|nr:efflux RND transporter periplasmic adaptor subunit [Gemmataceae bacterium]
MRTLAKTSALLLLLMHFPALAGCSGSQGPGGGPPPPPEVLVSVPINKPIIDYEDFPGRTEAINSIDVKARATGYLDRVLFKEGTEVKKGEVLFEIDPRTYQAELNRADAMLAAATAKANRMESDYQRAMTLVGKGSLSREEFDRIAGERNESRAAIGVAKANHDVAELNLSFTKVRSPIDGRISRRYTDPGNLVKADETVLTTIVSLDPIYVYFDLDERTTLRLKRLMREGKIKWSAEAGWPVEMGLSDEKAYPYRGMVTFTDNRVDAETGTWRLRAQFPNGRDVLAPGLYVRVRLPIGSSFPALLVGEQALGTNQGQRFVYVVESENKVAERRVEVGRLHDGLRVINDGLKPGEKVVVSGLQRVRPGIVVTPKLVEMPVMTASAVPSESKSAK